MAKQTIFQRIWNAEIPSYPLYRNDAKSIGLMAILDTYAATPGHTLVVPYEPAESWNDLPPHREFQAALLGRFLSRHLLETLSPTPLRIPKLNIGSQVLHVHDQFVPMYERGDTQRLWLPCRMEAPRPSEELEAIHAQLVFPDALSRKVDEELLKVVPIQE